MLNTGRFLKLQIWNKKRFKFYHKLGMEELGPEVDGKVIRMKGEHIGEFFPYLNVT